MTLYSAMSIGHINCALKIDLIELISVKLFAL